MPKTPDSGNDASSGMIVLMKSSFRRSWSERFAMIKGNSVLVFRSPDDTTKTYKHMTLNFDTRVSEVIERSKCYTVTLSSMDNGKAKSLELGHHTDAEAATWRNALLQAKAEAQADMDNLSQTSAAQSSFASYPKNNTDNIKRVKAYGHTPATIKALLEERQQNIYQALERKAQYKPQCNDEDQVVPDTVNFYGWRTHTVEGGLRIRIDEDMTSREKMKFANHINHTIKYALAATGFVTSVVFAFVVNDLFIAFLCGMCAGLAFCNHCIQCLDQGHVPTLQAAEIVRGSADEVFDVIMDDVRWSRIDGCTMEWKTVKRVDEHQEILHVVMNPVWKWLYWHKPRDLCLLRYWRREEDGSFLIIFQSTSHEMCPPMKEYVRDSLAGAVWTISPRIQGPVENNEPHSRVSFTVKYQSRGYYGLCTRFRQQLDFVLPLLRNVTALKEAMSYQDYVDRSIAQETLIDEPQLSESLDDFAHFRTSVNDQGLVLGVKHLDCLTPKDKWAEPSASRFLVRGNNYFEDRQKMFASPSVFNLVALDVLAFEDSSQCYNVCARPDNIVYQLAKDGNDQIPFTFVLNFVLPTSDNLAVVAYFQPSQKDWREAKDQFSDLFNDFIDGDDDFRNSRFKLIPKIEEGPFLLRKALAGKPVIIGNKGVRLIYSGSEHYFEIDIDLNSDAHARELTNMALGITKSIVVDIAFAIEPHVDKELPERILGAIRFNHIDLKVNKHIPKTMANLPANASFASLKSNSSEMLSTPIVGADRDDKEDRLEARKARSVPHAMAVNRVPERPRRQSAVDPSL
eukprot:Ihof_evm8s27 gene=Ihof_evmTU8s27